MNRLDISDWKEFKIAELFDINPTRYHKLINKDLFDEEGKNPVVVNSSYNNGIGGYSNYGCTEQGNTITFSDTTTADSIFYQSNDFVGYSHVQKLVPIIYKVKWTKNCLLFFMIVFRVKAKLMNFDYVNKFTRENALNLLIKLPVKNNIPDWEYMESYIKGIYSKERGNISVVTEYVEKSTTKRIDITKWGTFQIGELFEIKKPEVIHSKNVQECNLQNESDSIPYVVRTKFNNGIKCNIIKTSEMQPTISGVISFGAENTVFFYQKKEFVSGRDIYYIDTSYLSKNTCLFLVACLNTITHKYSYNNGLFPDLLRKENISLPITNQNTPDWKYMEDYISCLFQQQNNGLQQLL